jgi:hypothetical protein
MFGIAGQLSYEEGTAAEELPPSQLEAQLAADQWLQDLLPQVEAQLAPLLAAHGLSTTSCPDDVLAIDGLVEELVTALEPMMRLQTATPSTLAEGAGTGTWGWMPFGASSFGSPAFGASDRASGDERPKSLPYIGAFREEGREVRYPSIKGGERLDRLEVSLASWGGLAAEEPGSLPTFGCAESRSSGALPTLKLEYSYDGDLGADAIVDPNLPELERRDPDPCSARNARECNSTEHSAIDTSLSALKSILYRIPADFVGVDYANQIAFEMFFVDWRCNNCDHKTRASYNPSFPGMILLEQPFFEDRLYFLLLETLGISENEFRAAVLAHELVHLADTEDFGKPILDNTRRSCNRPACEEAGEYRAAYIQAMSMGLSKCISEAFGCAYMSGRPSPGCQLGTMAKVVQALYRALECNGFTSLWVLWWAPAIVALALINPAQALLAAAARLGGGAAALILTVLLDITVEAA